MASRRHAADRRSRALTVSIDVLSGTCDGCVPDEVDITYSDDSNSWVPDSWCDGRELVFYCDVESSEFRLIEGFTSKPPVYSPTSSTCDPFEIVFGPVTLSGGCTATITITSSAP